MIAATLEKAAVPPSPKANPAAGEPTDSFTDEFDSALPAANRVSDSFD
jgi:hypothetical protein